MSRLFVALEVPDAIREAVPRPTAPWRPIAPESLHVTLVFVGDRPEAHAALVSAAVERALMPIGELRVDLLAPSIDAPCVMALPLAHPTGACAALQTAVEREIVAEGILHASRRPWRPHLTIGRLPRSAAGVTLNYLPVPALAFTPPAVSVYASTPAPDGSCSEALARFPLPAT